jgi:hypothetical protein
MQQALLAQLANLGVSEEDFALLISFHPIQSVLSYSALNSNQGRKAYLENLLDYTYHNFIGDPSFGL